MGNEIRILPEHEERDGLLYQGTTTQDNTTLHYARPRLRPPPSDPIVVSKLPKRANGGPRPKHTRSEAQTSNRQLRRLLKQRLRGRILFFALFEMIFAGAGSVAGYFGGGEAC